MTRRSRYALTKVSADIPVSLVQQLDGWKSNIDGISRSQLISDLLKWSLDQGAIDALYPVCSHDHNHGPEVECDCNLGCCQMNTKTSAIAFAIVMVFSSFVGCIDTEEEKTESVTSPSSLGNVMVSTYHVAELARAVGGDRISVEIISPSNVPVHDYEPSASDLIRLQEVDLFFYHGLNLEPWVDSAISSLGSDAPLAVQTHAMPSGENTLDYQTMLLSNICEALNDDAYEAVTLADHHDEAGDVEIHAEAMTHKVSYPEMDDDHDDHGDDHDDHGDDHDDHGDDHDDHGDDHDDHG